MKIGIVVAHADDESYGMGGTLGRLSKLSKENELHLLVLADGASARIGASAQAVSERKEQAGEAGQVLCLGSLTLLDMQDNCLDTYPLLVVVQAVERWLAQVEPEVIYTHSQADLNLDHRITLQAVLTATRPQPGCTVREIYSFEVASSTEWGFGRSGTAFAPNVFRDITETIETKIAAIKCYASELRPYPHPRCEQMVRARAAYWGQVAGVEYAEAFELVRRIG